MSEIVGAGVNNNALVDTAWVLANLHNESVRLVDVSAEESDYHAGHLPNAVFVNWQSELTNPDSLVEGQILTAGQLETLFSGRGIGNDHTVVFYDGTSNLFATRAYWVLRHYSHADVRVYDGGSVKWVEQGNELVTDRVSFEVVNYVAGKPTPDVRADYAYVLASMDDENVVICDTRSQAEFIGEDVQAERGGHIPGAIHLEWTHAVNEDGTFKPVSELASLFDAVGFTPDKEILTYCQGGVRSAHTWFVLCELLGYPMVRNYDGSWAEWGNTDDAPIER